MPNRTASQLIENQTVLITVATTTVTAAAKAMKQAGVGAILVVEGERLVGIFTERDALNRVLAAGKDPARTTLVEVMTAEPTTITPGTLFGHALHIMYERGFRHVPVVLNGKPVGMVSARDAMGREIENFEEELRVREHIAEILG